MQVERIVVVGCGSIGRRHARNLASRDDVRVELYEPIAENLALAKSELGQVPAHQSFDEMLKTKPQMVVVATPHALHAEQSIAALEAGIHVLCEKPMSDNLADAQQMVNAAARSDRVLDVGFTLHFHPALLHIKRQIAAGDLGRVLQVHWHVGTYLTLMSSVSRHQATTFGALMMDYAHQPDLIYWWLGASPTRVFATGCVGEDLPLLASPNVAAVILEYDGPIMATINLNYVQHPERCFCEIIGDRAWVVVDLITNNLQMGRRNEEVIQEQTFKVERDEMFRAEHDAFIQAARGYRDPESPPHTAIKSMQVVEAAIESLRTRSPTPVRAALGQ